MQEQLDKLVGKRVVILVDQAGLCMQVVGALRVDRGLTGYSDQPWYSVKQGRQKLPAIAAFKTANVRKVVAHDVDCSGVPVIYVQ